MKILILSCNTGQGHNSAGNAVKEALEVLGVTCDMADALSFSKHSGTSDLISGAYVKIVSKVPLVFGGIYKAGDIISSPRFRSPIYLANSFSAARLAEYIKNGEYDGVVMPHVFPAETLTKIKRKGTARVRTYAVATDYTCSPFWEETKPDFFFIPHTDLAYEFASKGIPMEKLIPAGIPVSPKYSVKIPKAEAREKLGLPTDATVFLIMSGSMGFGDISGVTSELLRLMGDKPTRALIMTGRSEKLKARIAEDFGEDERVIAVPFTREVPLYMDACDVLLSKPGGLTSTEAAVKQVPFIHTKPIPGCETKNAKFFSSHGMSVYVKRQSDAAIAAAALASDEKAREYMTEKQRELMPKNAAESIAKFIIYDILKNS